jgi:hypothetical protein
MHLLFLTSLIGAKSQMSLLDRCRTRNARRTPPLKTGALFMDAEHRQVAADGRMLRRQLEEICNDAVQNEISAQLGPEEASRSNGGQYGNLLRRMSQAALEYALANNIEPSDFEDEVLRDALALVEGLRDAIPGRSNRPPNFLDDALSSAA